MTSRGELSCWSGPQLTVGTSVCQRLKILQMYGLFHCVCVSHAMMLHAHVHARFFHVMGFVPIMYIVKLHVCHACMICPAMFHVVIYMMVLCSCSFWSMNCGLFFTLMYMLFLHVVTCSCWFFSCHGWFMFTTLVFCHVHSGSWSCQFHSCVHDFMIMHDSVMVHVCFCA